MICSLKALTSSLAWLRSRSDLASSSFLRIAVCSATMWIFICYGACHSAGYVLQSHRSMLVTLLFQDILVSKSLQRLLPLQVQGGALAKVC